MNKNHKITVILLALLTIAGVARSQTAATVPYYCDFENAQERSDWQFSNDIMNLWIIDTATDNGGYYSLFVCPDSFYTDLPFFCFEYLSNSYAYRKIHFNAGLYNISFDWFFPGLSNYISFTYMRVFLIPATTTFTGGQRYPGISASHLPPNAIPVDFSGAQIINGGTFSRFSNPTVQIPVTDDYYLVFFFFCNGQYLRFDPNSNVYWSPAIDNINITAVQCQQPKALAYSDLGNGCISLDWDDVQIPAPTSWNIEYGPRGFQIGSGTQIAATSHPHTICGLQADSTYDFYVRSNCQNGSMSGYSDVLSICYKSETYLCRNFCDLKAPGTVCTYGQYEEHGDTIGEFYGPYSDTGIVNFGYQNYGDPNTMLHASRHTVHTDPAEFDSCSGYQLHTVPLGEASSVRLGTVYGRWICQSISYNILVDTSSADILIVQYACVLQNPSGHETLRKPRFILQILDRYGVVTDTVCLNYDFSGNNLINDTTWQRAGTRTYWKDWTRAGINLSNYHGQPLTIRLTTFACGQGADDHFGYAYFNLKCEKSDITGEVCGNDTSFSTALFKAPSGFSYRWYSPDNPNFSSSNQAIWVPLDNSVYHCDIFLGDPRCKFTKAIVASPNNVERRFIHANFRHTTDSLSCTHRLTVVNTSHSSDQNHGNIAYDCDFFLWDFGDNTTSSNENPLSHIYSGTGPYVVSLIAGRTDIGCYDTIVDTISFFPGVYNVIRADICEDSGYRFFNQVLTQSGIYTKLLTSDNDCDTTIELHLKVRKHPQIQIIGNNISCEKTSGTLLLRTNGNDIRWTSNPFDSTLLGHEHDTLIVVPRLIPTLYTVIVDSFPRMSDCNASASIWVNPPPVFQAFYRMSPQVISAQRMQIRYSDYSKGPISERQWTFHEIPDRFDDKEILNSRFVYYTPHFESDSLHVRLIVRNESNCADTLQNTYPILKGEVWVPNVFTPDANDNKVLKVGHHNINTYEIDIYNRVGQRVFHSSDPDECWDGTYNGHPCPSEAYVYHINYTTKSLPESSCEQNGSVLIVR